MKTIFKFIIGSAAVAGSGAVGYLVAKKKYLALVDKEVESVKTQLTEYYKNNGVVTPETKQEVKKEEPKTSVTQHSSIENFEGKTEKEYNNYAKPYQTAEVEQKVKATKEAQEKPVKKVYPAPYIISVEAFSESEYAAKTLHWYISDEILTDSDGRILEDPLSLVGKDFKQYVASEDCVHVRNEEIQMDFDIEFETKRFTNVATKNKIIKDEDED